MKEKIKIKHCINDKKIEHFQFLNLIQNILMIWKNEKKRV